MKYKILRSNSPVVERLCSACRNFSWPIIIQANNAVNQSDVEAKTCNQCQAREKTCNWWKARENTHKAKSMVMFLLLIGYKRHACVDWLEHVARDVLSQCHVWSTGSKVPIEVMKYCPLLVISLSFCTLLFRNAGSKVLVHCRMGISRSASTVNTWTYMLCVQDYCRLFGKRTFHNLIVIGHFCTPSLSRLFIA